MTIRTFYKSTKINIIIEFSNDKYWYKNGVFHRDNDLPAIEYADGYKAWYKNGERHRGNDLPAIEYSNGYKEWFKNGIRYFPNITK